MSQHVRTLGEFVRDERIAEWLADALRTVNASALRTVKEGTRRKTLPVAQCFACTSKKACCFQMVFAGLYEGLLIAARVKEHGRDTAALRAELKAQAEGMEATTPKHWNHACAFLDESERCTVYEVRPKACGTLYVFSPPELCRGDTQDIQMFDASREEMAGFEIEEAFRERLSLRRKVGRRYIGVLPRMVLVALEAWERTDFRDYLRQLPWPSFEDAQRWAPAHSVEPQRPGTYGKPGT